MSQSIPLLTVQDTVVAAAALVADADREKLDPRRAITGASSSAILSMAVLIGQFDRLAKTAARAEHAWHPPGNQAVETSAAIDASEAVQELLVEAGYLPLPVITQREEPAHGEG